MNKIYLITIFILLSIVITDAQQITNSATANQAKQSTEFKITTLNTEWLSCVNYGPTDEVLQQNNVVAAIKAVNPDVIALQEVGTSSIYATIDTLVRRLGNEWAGSIVPFSAENCSQNEAIIYKKAKVQLISASLITDGGAYYDWSSGRYPVLYQLNMIDAGKIIPVSLINIHTKAMSDEASYTRRCNASAGLKALLDSEKFKSKNIILLGDFNDYLTGTQCSSCALQDSPFKNFVDDTENYVCLTGNIYDPNYNSPLIDNIIISNELKDIYIPGSTIREVTAIQGISDYYNTTTDHTPVSTRFNFSGQAPNPDCVNISVSETFAASLGSFTPYSVDGLQTWSWRQYFGAAVSGYANTINNVNEDWLISPAYDLSDKKTATLTFNHALNYAPAETDKMNNHTLWVSSTYSDGSPANNTWKQLIIPVMPAGNNWTFVNAGNISLPAEMMQKNVRFAFKYISTATTAGTWEIKDLVFSGLCTTTGIDEETVNHQSSVCISGNRIRIENQSILPVVIYDIAGRLLFSDPAILNIEIPVCRQGIYLVKTGNEVFRVLY